MSIRETHCTIHWLEIYPVDSAIHLLNNRGLFINRKNTFFDFTPLRSFSPELQPEVRGRPRWICWESRSQIQWNMGFGLWWRLDINIGHVICRQLGYPEAIATPCCSAFGSGKRPFWLAGVKCQGNERSLFDCKLGEWGHNNGCGGYDVASVVCRTPNVSTCRY